MKGFQINIEEMKKKTEIEDKILYSVNKNLQEYINDIEYVRNNFKNIDSIFILNNIDNTDNTNNTDNKNELETKLFNFPHTIYEIFKFFYLKRKNYMGMNLTGLIQGKMETGLGFRSNIIKYTINSIKDEKIKSYITKKFNILTQDIIIYKIKSEKFEWTNFGLSSNEYYYIVANLDIKKYFIYV